jgi:hypothetical protein
MALVSSSSLSAEAQLAITALRVELDRAKPASLRDRLRADLDPERLTRFCVYHGIAPSVCRALKTIADAAAVEPLREALTPSVRACAAAGLRKAQVLSDILRRFAKAGIETVPLKGTGIDVRFYDGPGRRKDGDHDLLVRQNQLSDAARVLSEMGFQSSKPEAPPPSRWPETIPKHHGPPFFLPDETGPPVPVELHWNVSPSELRFPLHNPATVTQGIWSRSRSGSFLGAPVRWPAPIDEVLVLLLHAARHLTYGTAGLYVRLAMIEDIERALAGLPDVDPERLQKRVQGAGPVHILGPMRYLWRRALGAIPDELRAEPNEEWPPAWGHFLLSTPHLLGDLTTAQAGRGRPRIHKLRSALVSLLLLTRPADRATLARQFLEDLFEPNEKDYEALPVELPPRTRWLYQPVRLARLAWRLMR